eukprot:768453-Hanusia_phi.AAC.3
MEFQRMKQKSLLMFSSRLISAESAVMESVPVYLGLIKSLFIVFLGRLKPIYCDRLDDGILKSTAPLKIIKDNDATALVWIIFGQRTHGLTWLARLMETMAWA